jgi:hypothetical protein
MVLKLNNDYEALHNTAALFFAIPNKTPIIGLTFQISLIFIKIFIVRTLIIVSQ